MSSLYILWLGAVVLLLLSLAVLLPHLLQDSAAAAVVHRSDAALRSLYRAQWQELERERHAGNLSETDWCQAKEELQRRLLLELDRRAAPTTWRHRPWLPRLSALVLAVALPIAAVVLYVQVGDPQAAVRLAQADDLGHGAGQVQVSSMVEGLAQRLQAAPDDLPGWVMLARSYEVMERYADAVHAYERALQLASSQGLDKEAQARLWADLADAQGSAHDGILLGDAAFSISQSLALQPLQAKALALAGSAAVQAGDYALARQHWQTLLGRLEPGSDVALRVQDDLMQLDLLLHGQ